MIRYHEVKVRLTADEHAALKAATPPGLLTSAYARSLILTHMHNPLPAPPAADPGAK